jgi:hypothetical protein
MRCDQPDNGPHRDAGGQCSSRDEARLKTRPEEGDNCRQAAGDEPRDQHHENKHVPERRGHDGDSVFDPCSG